MARVGAYAAGVVAALFAHELAQSLVASGEAAGLASVVGSGTARRVRMNARPPRPSTGPTPIAERCVVFMHLPKNGGTTLTRAFRWKYRSQLLVLERESLTRSMEETAEAVPLSRRREARVVAGHLHYGIHKHIPRECAYVTMLREPVARAISMYHYILGEPRHWAHDELVRSGVGLEEFFRDPACPVVDNEQTRFICGMGSHYNEPGSAVPELGADALEQAKRNLGKFLVVGLHEKFDESFILIRRALRWKLPMYVTSNVTEKPKSATGGAIEQIREREHLDLELYEFARELFAAAVAEQGPSFRHEVAAFKTLNRIPDKLGPRVPVALRRRLKARLPR